MYYFLAMYSNRFCGNVVFAFNILLKYSLVKNARSSVASTSALWHDCDGYGPPGYCSTIPCTLIRLISELRWKLAATGTFKKQACTANSFQSGLSNECPRADIGWAKTRVIIERDEEGKAEVSKKESGRGRQTELDIRMLSHTANGTRVQDDGGERGAIGVGDEVDEA